jgi:trehalose-6-phosphate hydrolase
MSEVWIVHLQQLLHAGFTSGTPWIDIPNNFDKINVEAAVEDEQSILQVDMSEVWIVHLQQLLQRLFYQNY